ncbi:MBL fold metallo-hydrolase [Corallincola holothuriorum]|uniref:MBL fold metallo-hydrolase n=1 Tax=Corallincola holothuriorum TaxID=2282215 RepID=A0A368NMH6_9GAMM|nr:MBL fold metallo-hydrolase [Corallincola holothuriorum]RCU51093.1 MBL fold metallo-hydrolase [Corallincola holothuriorum]
MRSIWLGLLSICFSYSALADDRFADVEIEKTALRNGVYMLTGSGGNIGASAGTDGLLIVDDQYAPLADKISAVLQELSPQPLKYVVNTHMHGDHTGGNAEFGKSATIFAHHHVLERLSQDDSLPRSAMPVVTYADGVTFHFNDLTIEVQHYAKGHTDGDSVVWFKQANVLHMGDLFFNGKFPFIDLKRGGSVMGYLNSVKALSSQVNNETQIIPGHGPLADKAALAVNIEMLETHISWVKTAKAEGKTLQQLLDEGVPEQWKSWSWRFIDEKRWIETLFQGL